MVNVLQNLTILFKKLLTGNEQVCILIYLITRIKHNIYWSDVQRNNVVNDVDRSSLWAP